MPGDLNQSVHLGVLPEGLNFTITAIEPSIPGDGWTAVFSHPDFGEISHGQYVRHARQFLLLYHGSTYPR